MSCFTRFATCGALLAVLGTAQAASVTSDGSDGAYVALPGVNVLDLTLPGRESGIFNFTTITVPVGATLVFKRGAGATPPVTLAATGEVQVLGTIDVSARGGLAGPGGGEGGAGGLGDAACVAADCIPTQAGGGLLGGNPGPNANSGGIKSTPGYAGSGGGMATQGLAADPARFSASAPATDAFAALPSPLAGGSGGGGGGGWMFFGVQLAGGAGGDGAGALQITTPGSLVLGGTLLANGGNGVWGFTNSGGTGGPGGGGSGGNFRLIADDIAVLDSAVVSAVGGWGGCLGTETCDLNRPALSKLNNGGLGFFDLTARDISIDPRATLSAVVALHAVPLPAGLPLFGGGLLCLLATKRRKPPR
ncbi:MAG: hypothetical protein AB7P42_12925 [Gammaproteobacteria bacterium]